MEKEAKNQKEQGGLRGRTRRKEQEGGNDFITKKGVLARLGGSREFLPMRENGRHKLAL